jgi:hypothetical protein
MVRTLGRQFTDINPTMQSWCKLIRLLERCHQAAMALQDRQALTASEGKELARWMRRGTDLFITARKMNEPTPAR